MEFWSRVLSASSALRDGVSILRKSDQESGDEVQGKLEITMVQQFINIARQSHGLIREVCRVVFFLLLQVVPLASLLLSPLHPQTLPLKDPHLWFPYPRQALRKASWWIILLSIVLDPLLVVVVALSRLLLVEMVEGIVVCWVLVSVALARSRRPTASWC